MLSEFFKEVNMQDIWRDGFKTNEGKLLVVRYTINLCTSLTLRVVKYKDTIWAKNH